MNVKQIGILGLTLAAFAPFCSAQMTGKSWNIARQKPEGAKIKISRKVQKEGQKWTQVCEESKKLEAARSKVSEFTPETKPGVVARHYHFFRAVEDPEGRRVAIICGQEYRKWEQLHNYAKARMALLPAINNSHVLNSTRANYLSTVAQFDLLLGNFQEAYEAEKVIENLLSDPALVPESDKIIMISAKAFLGSPDASKTDYLLEYFKHAFGPTKRLSEVNVIASDPHANDIRFLTAVIFAQDLGRYLIGFDASDYAYHVRPNNPLVAYYYANNRMFREKEKGLEALQSALEQENLPPIVEWRLKMEYAVYVQGPPPGPEPKGDSW